MTQQMKHSSQPWWTTEVYDRELAVPDDLLEFQGPEGIALVKAWQSGLTDPGWGLNPPKDSREGFMPRYMKGNFASRRVVYGFEQGKWFFAFVMRSLRLVCIDIDGKNGGILEAMKLGMLPITLAETSKSGDGYHLFYSVDDEWDPDIGFGKLNDRIGIVQGVDVRATGCVYHHPQQRWNGRPIVPLPDHLYQTLTARDQKIAATNARIKTVLANEDPLEVLMMQDALTEELRKPIPQGMRNQTLFAIGSQMCIAEVPDWEVLVGDRAVQVGLDSAEADKLVANIERYGASQATP